jgi:ubiquinone/menaquinone biosynthesis C-methylase UbiE
MKDTSWEKVADWYDTLLEGGKGTYQKEVILPNLLRLMRINKEQAVLDLACGQGYFAREFYNAGAKVIGVDLSEKLIELARKNSPKDIVYHAAPADNLKFLKDKSVDSIALILAIQNIENVSAVFKECGRVLKDGGKIFIVMNHPVFRIPKESDWGWDEKNKIQFRRVDGYLTESKVKIDMTPGQRVKEFTISFHRSLQYYFKLISNNILAVSRLEEWISNKKSGAGPRQAAEDCARKEIPLFLCLEIVKL